MNENKVVYRKEYVENAIELLKTSETELEESIDHINMSLEKIITANEYPYIDNIDKNLKDNKIEDLLKNLMSETVDNLQLLESASNALEEYNRNTEEYNRAVDNYSYQNPQTGGTPNPTIKNGPAIAALAGLAAVGASALLDREEEKEKTES